jgi:hypothetical protein
MEFNRIDHIMFRETNHSAARQNFNFSLRNFRRDA